MKPMKLNAGRNWLWLWILPAALSWLLVWLTRPAGGAALWAEIGIVCLCSCLCGFALAFRGFSTIKERLWGGLFFTGASLGVFSSVLFLGCGLLAGDTWQKSPVQREIENRARVAKQITPRDARADPTMLDLTSFYQKTLPHSFRALEPGTHSWDGIKFDVRGLVARPQSPDGQIPTVPVRQKCSGISFLNGYAANNQQDLPFRFLVYFANGHEESVPLVFGKDYATTNAIVWDQSRTTNGSYVPDFIFYIKKWNNPYPDVTVSSIDFVGSSGVSFLAAITIRPVNP